MENEITEETNEKIEFVSKLSPSEREAVTGYLEANRDSAISLGDLQGAVNSFRMERARAQSSKSPAVSGDEIVKKFESLKGGEHFRITPEAEAFMEKEGLWRNPSYNRFDRNR